VGFKINPKPKASLVITIKEALFTFSHSLAKGFVISQCITKKAAEMRLSSF
jgi:hypothetical protein